MRQKNQNFREIDLANSLFIVSIADRPADEKAYDGHKQSAEKVEYEHVLQFEGAVVATGMHQHESYEEADAPPIKAFLFIAVYFVPVRSLLFCSRVVSPKAIALSIVLVGQSHLA
jgi:hypothetical protein